MAQNPSTLQQDLGPAVSAILLVSDWAKYGPTECAVYHFRLIDSLFHQQSLPASSEGIVGLLECVPTKVIRKHRRSFRRIVRNFKGTYHFPLIANPQTQIAFAYEMTRIAFVLDASPTLTSTYGFSCNTGACCPMDNVQELARSFLTSLVRPIQCQYRSWLPDIAITVLAVYPGSSGDPPISLLVRDFRLSEQESVDQLLSQLQNWCLTEVETEIAKRMSRDTTVLQANATSVLDLLNAGQAALSTLGSAAQPCVVLATDSRAVACDSVIDFLTNEPELLDTHVSVLDLRPSLSDQVSCFVGTNLLNYDPNGALFPLHLSDDSEALRNICSATFGKFWDKDSLREASTSSCEESGKRYSIQINAVQSQTLLRASPMGPGRLFPQSSQILVTISKYFINPIPITEILLMRIKEGYRVKHFRFNESDCLSIHAAMHVDYNTTIHYEISYKPSNALVGVAHIHMDLSGDANFVRYVKNTFVHNQHKHPESMVQQIAVKLCKHLRGVRVADLLQSYLSPMRWSDQLDSATSPFARRLATLSTNQRRRHFHRDTFDCVCTGQMPWENTGFLSEFRDDDDGSQQLLRKVQDWATQQIDEFRFVRRTNPECGVGGYCVVELRYSPVASRLVEVIVESFAGISSLRRREIIDELKEALDQLKCVDVLEKQMGRFLVGEPIRKGIDMRDIFHHRVLAGHHNRASWDLVKDPELIPLVMRRRKEIGKFHLLENSESYALFSKLKLGRGGSLAPGDQVQYELSVKEDKVTVELHMEGESGMFLPLRQAELTNQHSQFHAMVRSLRTRERECSHALRCRTRLLNLIDADERGAEAFDVEPITSCIEKLLDYGSSTSCRLRFFKSGNELADSILEDLTRDTILAQSSKQGLRAVEVPIGRWNSASWFIVEHDKQTLSVVHLSNTSERLKSQEPLSRQLVYHTVSLSDLYNRRDDVVDEETDDHISEHIQVVEMCESVEESHRYNFATAAYTGLRRQTLDIDNDDFAQVLSVLTFVEVAQAIPVPPETGATLSAMLHTVLRPVECSPGHFVYVTPDDLFSFPSLDEDSELVSVYGGESSVASLMLADEEEDSHVATTSTAGDSAMVEEAIDTCDVAGPVDNPAPIFVSFLKDGSPMKTDEISVHERSAHLSVLLSVYRLPIESRETRSLDPAELDPFHVEAALNLSTILNAYVAEQNLERLRYHGTDISETDTRLARAYLRKARCVSAVSLEMFFYSVKKDAIVSASSQTSDIGNDISSGFSLLAEEFQSNQALKLSQYGSRDSFLSLETNEQDVLTHWAFVKIVGSSGSVAIEVQHPEGLGEASTVRDALVDFVFQCRHRVNQVLMLKNLLQSRVASSLLIPMKSAGKSGGGFQDLDGSFGCDIMYRTSFELYHRCAANPVQVTRKLEASVLQNFAVSNRPGVFVYKDESDSVFYLELSTSKEHENEQIDLVVRGLSPPGPSITSQLRNLLQKRLLLIAVDLLSTVLTKNYWYGWKQEDIDFIHSFRSDWELLDNRKEYIGEISASRLYEIPAYVSDPAMLLLLFRQNICGSFFFFPLQTGEDAFRHDGIELTLDVNSESIKIDAMNLRFFFNASKSTLDPAFQAESTLTERGHEISRQVGSGVAIVYVSLVPLGEVVLGSNVKVTSTRPVKCLNEFRLKEVQTGSSRPYIRVTVVDTNLKQHLVHEWVLLTLNQVVHAWLVERHIEGMTKNMFETTHSDSPAPLTNSKQDTLVPGLPFFGDALRDGLSLPHPAVKALMLDGVVRSSSVASLSIELLRTIASEIENAGGKRVDERTLQGKVIRCSRFGDPELVRLEKSGVAEGRVLVHRHGELNPIADSSLDCVEYTILFLSVGKDGANLPKVFEDVSVAFSKSEVSEASGSLLHDFKERHAAQFFRSFGFILSVKRNNALLLTYNWKARLVDRSFPKLQEVNQRFSSSTSSKASSLLCHSLGILAPKPASESVNRASVKEKDRPPRAVTSSSSRTLNRLQPLRRPKLIGKSVEGSAKKAVEASRARAASKRPGLKTLSAGTTRRDTMPKGESSVSTGTSSVNAKIEDGKMSSKVRHSFKEACDGEAFCQARRRVTWHKTTTSMFWPMAPPYEIDLAVAQTIFQRGFLIWFDAAPMIPSIERSGARFLHSLCQTLEGWSPTLTVIKYSPEIRIAEEFYLVSKPHKIGAGFYFNVIRLAILNQNSKRLVTSECRGLFSRGKHLHSVSQRANERRGAHAVSLSNRLRSGLSLPSYLFDHACLAIERALQSSLNAVEYNHALRIARSIIEGAYPLKEVLSLPSSFKLFEATIVLKSYRDELIDAFDGKVLVKWLSEHTPTNMISCGRDGLCFKQKIAVCSTSSKCCIFSCNDTGKLKLLFVSRMNGRSLNSFTFRDGNSTAMSLLDNIAVEGASLAYQELRLAAAMLRQNQLWLRFSTSQASRTTQSELFEFVKLCKPKSLSNMLGGEEGVAIIELLQQEDLIAACLEAMLDETAFSPSGVYEGTPHGLRSYLFFVPKVNSFLFVHHPLSSPVPLLYVLSRTGLSSAGEQETADIFVNFLLHFVWSCI